MSDPPSKPKPGSLRDRIAAFEKPSSTSTPSAGPPPPRPKPGGISWKPKQPSPPSSPSVGAGTGDGGEKKSGSGSSGGMSASDARQTIGMGGSLKERMAALKGRGGFGPAPTSPPPPVSPKPAVEKPKWKPPPAPVALPDEAEDHHEEERKEESGVEGGEPAEDGSSVKSPEVEAKTVQSESESQEKDSTVGEEPPAEVDPEEEERQRRAAIAARMARLGGARVGMGPPVFGKPTIKKKETPREETAPKVAEAVPVSPQTAAEEDISESKELLFNDEHPNRETESVKAPPAAEAPSAKSDEKDKADYFPSSTTVLSPDTTSVKSQDTSSVKSPASSSLLSPEPPSSTGSTPSPRIPNAMPMSSIPRRAAPPRKRAKSPVPPPPEPEEAKAEEEELQKDEEKASHEGQDVAEERDVTTNEIKADAEDEAASKREPETAVSGPPSRKASLEKPLSPPSDNDSTPTPIVTSETQNIHDDKVTEGDQSSSSPPTLHKQEVATEGGNDVETVSKPELEEQEEDDEEARKRRIAERLAKMGGVNPFAPQPPRRKSSEAHDVQDPVRKASVDSQQGPERQGMIRSIPVRKATADSRREPVRQGSIGSVLSGHNNDDAADDVITKHELERRVSESIGEQTLGVYSHHDDIPHNRDSRDEEEPEEEDEKPPAVNFRTRPTPSAIAPPVDEPEEISEVDEPPPPPPPPRRAPSHDEQVPQATRSSHSRRATQNEDVIVASPSSSPSRSITSSAQDNVSPPPPTRQAREASLLSSPPLKRQSIPPPARMIPNSPEEEGKDEASSDVEEPVAPPPVPSSPPPRRVPPPRQVLDDDDGNASDASAAPLPVPHPQRKFSLMKSTMSDSGAEESEREHDEDVRPARIVPPPLVSPPPPVPATSRPSRLVSPPPPPPPPSAVDPQPGFDDEDEEDEEEEEGRPILPTPPPRHMQPPAAIREQEEDAPLVIPPPKRSSTLSSTVSSTSSRTQVQPAPAVSPTPAFSVSSHGGDEILDEEEGDPIDPSFHSPSRRTSQANLKEAAQLEQQSSPQPPPPQEPEEDEDQARRRTIAERMARLGGIKFGAAPPVPMSRPTPRREQSADEEQHDSNNDDEKPQLTEEEEERARKERIAAKLASMGGMRFGMMPGMNPPRAPPPKTGESPSASIAPPVPSSSHSHHPPPPQRAAPPPRAPPPPQDLESDHGGSQGTSDDGVKVEAEESEIEEVGYEEAQEEAVEVEAPPPPLPTREGRRASAQPTQRVSTQSPPSRPAVPPPIRRPSVPQTQTQQRKPSVDVQTPTTSSYPPPPPKVPQSESYVMVEEPEGHDDDDQPPPPPPPRPVSRPPPARGVPAPPPAPVSVPMGDMSESMTWELPDFNNTQADLSLSFDDLDSPSGILHSAPPKSAKASAPRAVPQNLSSDDLMSIWGRVGVQICEVATALHDKSKRALIGDGTYHGFVEATLREVPNAAPVAGPDSYGYLIYMQSGSSVQKRASEILPGDVVWLQDAKLKGHKGIQTYNQHVGSKDEPCVGIVSEFEAKKFKVRVFQANQHVGQQTVETVSYRLEDLKSGVVKIFRVLEA